MKILLIRHLESSKNINEHHFTSNENHEELTSDGKKQGEKLSEIIAEYINNNSLAPKYIYCANSKRSVETAKMIANATNTRIESYNELNSIKDKAFAGMSEEEVEKVDPEFIYQLKLYRLGLFNSFHIKHVEQNERLLDFEKRVVETIKKIMQNVQENLKIIVLHRSSMLATLFYFVRKYYGFPKDYYGYVQIDVGNICVLEIDSDSLMITAVNKNPEFLKKAN